MIKLLGMLLMGLAGPIAVRVMIALGLGTVSYVGLTAAANVVVNHILSNYSGLSAFPAAMLNLSGAGVGLGIITSAFITRVAIISIKKLAVMA